MSGALPLARQAHTTARRRSAMHGESGFERRERDAYWTEAWVTGALLDAVRIRGPIWEPACGRGDMVDVLRLRGHRVLASDIVDHGCGGALLYDFLSGTRVPLPPDLWPRSVVTNPPYEHAEAFIRRALEFMCPMGGQVAMLLRHEFDCAAGRSDLFDCLKNPFACKVTLTRRPRWDWWERDKVAASPRHNFSWYLWDYAWIGEPVIRRGPVAGGEAS